jgi:limonene 1,2-monooxygenase
MSYLRSGIFLAPFHSLDENPTLSLERDLDLIAHIDRLNYHEAWIGEHHSGGIEIIGAPDVFIAVASQRTKRIRLGTGVLSLPYHNPFILADRMVQLDHLTRGRAMFGVGPGALVHDADKIGIVPAEQRPIMDAALDVIIRLLDGETVTVKNNWFTLKDAILQLPCYSQPRMEMVVATAITPSGAMAAGKHGIGMLSMGGTSPEALKRHAANWQTYANQMAAHGHVPDRSTWRMVGMFHIAETREKALQNIQFGLKPYGDYYRDVANFPIIPPGVEDNLLKFLTESGAACIGTPDDAIAYIQKMIDATGGIGLIAELAHNWADWPATLRHYELMARYVHPHFQRSRERMARSYELGRANQKRFQQEANAARQLVIERHKAPAAPTA